MYHGMAVELRTRRTRTQASVPKSLAGRDVVTEGYVERSSLASEKPFPSIDYRFFEWGQAARWASAGNYNGKGRRRDRWISPLVIQCKNTHTACMKARVSSRGCLMAGWGWVAGSTLLAPMVVGTTIRLWPRRGGLEPHAGRARG
jgi:hypothetical protein